MSNDAVITGASTGIGRAAVKVLTGHGWRVFAGVRKQADADSLRQEFGDKVEQTDLSVYAKTDYAESAKKFFDFFVSRGRAEGLPPEVIGEAIYAVLTAAKPKARYAVVPKQFVNWTIPRLLPKRTVDRLIGKQLGLVRKV
jgi:NAD(P)-dependent dehydrogenase (short-subunit alcohol dehydrogenase family)